MTYNVNLTDRQIKLIKDSLVDTEQHVMEERDATECFLVTEELDKVLSEVHMLQDWLEKATDIFSETNYFSNKEECCDPVSN